MNCWLRKLLIIACYVSLGVARANDDLSPARSSLVTPTEIDLNGAVQQAMKNSTVSLKSENNWELNQSIETQSEAQFLPNLLGTGQVGHYSGTTLSIIQTPYLMNATGTLGVYDLSSTLNLFNGFADVSGLSASKDREKAAHLSLVRTRQYAAMDMVQTYLRVVLDQELLEIQENNLKVSQDRLKLFRGQTRVGVTSTADLFREQAQVSNDQLLLIRARTQYSNDKLVLVQKLRFSPYLQYTLRTPVLSDKTDDVDTANTEKYINIAFEERDDWKSAGYQTHAAQSDITSARSLYYPLINLNFDLNGEGRVLDNNIVNGVNQTPVGQTALVNQLGNQNIFTASVMLTWSIFDRYQTQLNVERADVASANLDIDREDLRIRIVSEVKQAVVNFLSAEEGVRASQDGLTAAQKAYQVIDGRYQVGQANFIDLVAAQSDLVSAQANHAQALIELRIQRDYINYTTGKNPE